MIDEAKNTERKCDKCLHQMASGPRRPKPYCEALRGRPNMDGLTVPNVSRDCKKFEVVDEP